MLLSKLLERIAVLETNVPLGTEITGLTDSNGRVAPGNAFICIVGTRWDGHIFAGEVVAKGAAAVIVQTRPDDLGLPYVLVENTRIAASFLWMAWYGNPSDTLTLIGVTGTNGKSSIINMLKSIFDAADIPSAALGTIKNIIGSQEYESALTTPDPQELARLLRQIADEGIRYVVMEVSSHALELEKVAALRFELAIFTNLTQDHLDFHKTMEAYLRAKAKLFTKCKIGLLNRQDDATPRIMELSDCRNYTYAIDDNAADFVAKEVKYRSMDGVEYDLLCADDLFRIHCKIPGRFTVYNTLAAASAAKLLGVDTRYIAEGIYKTAVKGRIEKLDTGTDYSVIIDYAHTPDALKNVLEVIREFAPARLITLFGCGGDRDKTKRPIMGKIASQKSDFCIITSDNCRSEEPQAIIDDILTGVVGTNHIAIVDRAEAIRYALSIAKTGDILLLAGKGHEEYDKNREGTCHFSEKEVVFEALGVTSTKES